MYSENTWVITDTGHKPNRTIRFAVQLPGGRCLTSYPNLLDSIKRIVYGSRSGPLMAVESGGAQASIAANLLVLARWMLSVDVQRFDELTSSDVEEFAELATFGAHAILNSEGILTHRISALTVKAGFHEEDTPEQRVAKAKTAFPFRNCNGQFLLNRAALLADAGIGGIGFHGTASALYIILDEIERLCLFYQPPAVQKRMKAEKVLDQLDDKVVTEEQLRRLILPFELLSLHRRYLEDAIHFMPFGGSTARSVARKLGKKVQRTRTIPIEQAAVFLERCARWVLDYSPLILEAKQWADIKYDSGTLGISQRLAFELEHRKWPLDGPCQPFPLRVGRSYSGSEFDGDELPESGRGLNLSAALNFLVAACASIIAAFSARRAAEVVGLKVSCIERDDTGQPFLRVFIHKTMQSEDLVPIPEIVTNAVSVLEQLSERARKQTLTPYIFQFNFAGTATCVGLSADGYPNFPLGTHLRRLGYFLDVPEMPDRSRWTFRPHQFRRFFAVLYIWLYELGDWGALAYHLRHFNLEMTRRYVTDDELGHIISIANKEHTASILASAVLGSGQLSGAQGDRLKAIAKRLYDRMTQGVQVASERKFKQRIARMVERSGITLRAMPWGYCGAPKSPHAKEFKCTDTTASTPDFGQASLSACSNCSYNVRTAATLPYLTSTLAFHKRVASSSDTPEILRRASESHYVEFSRYIASVSSSTVTTREST